MIVNPAYNPFRLDYWFGQTDARPLALFRVLFALLLLKDAIYHIPLARLFYSDEGLYPLHVMHEMARTNRFSLMDALHAPWMATAFFLLWCVVILHVLIGSRTRLMTILNFIMILSVHERNLYLLNGADTVMRVLSFWAIFLPLGAAFSVDALRRRRQAYLESRSLVDLRPPVDPPTVWAFPVRIIQIQIALVYIFATVHKLPGEPWLTGEALYYALQIETLQIVPGRLLLELTPPPLLRLMTWAALLTEASWAILVFQPFFQPIVRRIALIMGVAFHFGIALTMAIPNFSIVMVISYVLFLEGDTIEAAIRAVWRHPLRIPPPAPRSAAWWLVAILPRQRLKIDRTAKPLALLERLGAVGWPRPERDADPTVRQASLLVRPARALTGALLTFLMGTIIWWNLANVELAGDEALVDRVDGAPRTMVQVTGLWQSWKLFAPYPSRTYGWIAVPGVFEDDVTYDLRTGQPEGDTFARWVLGPNARWRKYEDRLRRDGSEAMLRALGSYYCDRYEDLPEGERLATLEIHYHWRRSPDPGEAAAPYATRSLWRHWCYPQYAY